MIVRRNHVMKDLRPYVCTHPDCSEAKTHYGSRTEMIDHELKKHETFIQDETLRGGLIEPSTKLSDRVSCPFCRKSCPRLDTIERGRHIGRHMEEIAFVVVPTVYEEWEFYSNCSNDQFAPRIDGYQCTVAHCSESFDIKIKWKWHERMHYTMPTWRCREAAGTTSSITRCFNFFFDDFLYRRHLELVHSVDHQAMSCRISETCDWADKIDYYRKECHPSQFWCGFCCRIVDLKTGGRGACEERSDHIASQHFEFGQRMDSWRLPDEDSMRRLGELDGICV